MSSLLSVICCRRWISDSFDLGTVLLIRRFEPVLDQLDGAYARNSRSVCTNCSVINRPACRRPRLTARKCPSRISPPAFNFLAHELMDQLFFLVLFFVTFLILWMCNRSQVRPIPLIPLPFHISVMSFCVWRRIPPLTFGRFSLKPAAKPIPLYSRRGIVRADFPEIIHVCELACLSEKIAVEIEAPQEIQALGFGIYGLTRETPGGAAEQRSNAADFEGGDWQWLLGTWGGPGCPTLGARGCWPMW